MKVKEKEKNKDAKGEYTLMYVTFMVTLVVLILGFYAIFYLPYSTVSGEDSLQNYEQKEIVGNVDTSSVVEFDDEVLAASGFEDSYDIAVVNVDSSGCLLVNDTDRQMECVERVDEINDYMAPVLADDIGICDERFSDLEENVICKDNYYMIKATSDGADKILCDKIVEEELRNDCKSY